MLLAMCVPQNQAEAGADRKESDPAGGPAVQGGPESECREAQPGAQ
jgi:hypothetical protein